tara:strand:- start:523 stop:642 length:120 start_codon:yes stop_codon:yes gene_type:complete
MGGLPETMSVAGRLLVHHRRWHKRGILHEQGAGLESGGA